MLIEKAACTFISKIAGGKTGDRHGLLDYLFRRWRKAQFKPLRFVFPLRRYWFLAVERHNRSPQLYVRQYTVLYKSDRIEPDLAIRAGGSKRGAGRLRPGLFRRRQPVNARYSSAP